MGKSEEEVRLSTAVEGTAREVDGEPGSDFANPALGEQQHREGDG